MSGVTSQEISTPTAGDSIRVDGEIHYIEQVLGPDWYQVRPAQSLSFPLRKVNGEWVSFGPGWHGERLRNVRTLQGEYL